jgi:hypothetical protein
MQENLFTASPIQGIGHEADWSYNLKVNLNGVIKGTFKAIELMQLSGMQ